MTNRRYFYTDPLAAAWMAKHFGMEFDWFSDQGNGPVAQTPESIAHDILYPGTGGRYYIHPDSLHLLEPQARDTVLFFDNGPLFGREVRSGRQRSSPFQRCSKSKKASRSP